MEKDAARKEDDNEDDKGRSKELGGRICCSGQKMGGLVGNRRARRRATVTMAVDPVTEGVGERGVPSQGLWGCALQMKSVTECGGGVGAKPGTVGVCVAHDRPGRGALLSILHLSLLDSGK